MNQNYNINLIIYHLLAFIIIFLPTSHHNSERNSIGGSHSAQCVPLKVPYHHPHRIVDRRRGPTINGEDKKCNYFFKFNLLATNTFFSLIKTISPDERTEWTDRSERMSGMNDSCCYHHQRWNMHAMYAHLSNFSLQSRTRIEIEKCYKYNNCRLTVWLYNSIQIYDCFHISDCDWVCRICAGNWTGERGHMIILTQYDENEDTDNVSGECSKQSRERKNDKYNLICWKIDFVLFEHNVVVFIHFPIYQFSFHLPLLLVYIFLYIYFYFS